MTAHHLGSFSGGNTLTEKMQACLVLTDSFRNKAGFACRWSGVTFAGCGNLCCAVLSAHFRRVVAVIVLQV